MEHQAADGAITSEEPVRVQGIESGVDATLLLDVDGRAIAVLPDGVAGLNYPDGTPGWTYRVPEHETAVDITADSEAVVLTHTIPGPWGTEQLQETVLAAGTGEILHQDQLPDDSPVAPELGTDDLRVLNGPTLQAQWRSPEDADGHTDAWEVDPTTFCTDGEADPETELAADNNRLYLAIACANNEGRLVALAPRSGETEWEHEFTPTDGAPEVLLISNELRAGPGHDPVSRALNGEFGTGHRYLDTMSGNSAFPPGLEDPDTARVLETHFALPAPNGPVDTFVLATHDTVDAHVVHQSVQHLLDQGVLSPDDLDERAFKKAEEHQMHTYHDPEYYFDVPRNRLRDALEGLAE